MSGNGKDASSPITEGSDEPEDNAELTAMRQMMGFSSFGGPQKPKRQPRVPGPGKGFGTGANTQPIQPRNSSVSKTTPTTTLSATSHPFVPASLLLHRPGQILDSFLPPDASSIAEDASDNPPTPSTAFETTSTRLQSELTQAQSPRPADTTRDSGLDSNLDEVAYTHPTTGYSLTKRELIAYERGVVEQVVNKDGTLGQVKVYFRPSFVEDNPWEELEVKADLKKTSNEQGVSYGG